MSESAKWYVVHTYSGYENKVKMNIEKKIENRKLQDLIQKIEVPTEEVIEEKNGKRKVVVRKIFPSYVLIKMIMNDDIWGVIRNTRGVTGFVGPGSKPVPLTSSEVSAMGINEINEVRFDVDIQVGETIQINAGQLENFTAIVTEVNLEKRKVKGLVNLFGRETQVELEFEQISKLV